MLSEIKCFVCCESKRKRRKIISRENDFESSADTRSRIAPTHKHEQSHSRPVRIPNHNTEAHSERAEQNEAKHKLKTTQYTHFISKRHAKH